jgi:hypothetical protein
MFSRNVAFLLARMVAHRTRGVNLAARAMRSQARRKKRRFSRG